MSGIERIELLTPGLGDHVRFHHRACVARRQGGGTSPRSGFWTLHEGSERYTPVPGLPAGRINKTLLVWPEDGDGIVIGLVRRGIGISHFGSSYSDDPGGFTVLEYHDLFQVKRFLKDRSHMLVPLWAVCDLERR
jgi:hypothetical protein